MGMGFEFISVISGDVWVGKMAIFLKFFGDFFGLVGLVGMDGNMRWLK